ncbi:MAG: exodeoxyribonuclease VII large subunit [Eubacterium sp.]|nr:exodeoxyribonuclease VII large subunit [Eubacterium sp.]
MKPLSVSEINRIIKYKLKEIPQFRSIYVVGELTNFNERSRYGHWYFDLKDAGGKISCNMFMNYQSVVRFEPSNGMKVICGGYIDVYEKQGSYQLYVTSMNTIGAGDEMLALEQLKEKLRAEGIFDEAHKKPLPEYPRKIGLVTSASAAAAEDIKSNIARRWGLSEIVLAPCLVQGERAPGEIVRSISVLDNIPEIDVIIVARGGGANDDLKAFNTEAVARAVYMCNTPVISAVGHEVDTTLCDAAADVRVPTPSTAAEIAVPDKNAELKAVDEAYSTLLSIVKMKVEREEARLAKASFLSNRNLFYERLEQTVKSSAERIDNSYRRIVGEKEFALCRTADKLNALSPLSVLGRGYSITMKDLSVVNSVKDIKSGDKIEIVLTDGRASAAVTEVKKNE